MSRSTSPADSLLRLDQVGWVAQALRIMYSALRWLFENASQIFSVVETIVNGARDLINGNSSGMVRAIERALGGIVPLVIGLFAAVLGIGGLPRRVVGVIRSLQRRVDDRLDGIVNWLYRRARSLFSRGRRGRRSRGDRRGRREDRRRADRRRNQRRRPQDNELGETVRFRADG